MCVASPRKRSIEVTDPSDSSTMIFLPHDDGSLTPVGRTESTSGTIGLTPRAPQNLYQNRLGIPRVMTDDGWRAVVRGAALSFVPGLAGALTLAVSTVPSPRPIPELVSLSVPRLVAIASVDSAILVAVFVTTVPALRTVLLDAIGGLDWGGSTGDALRRPPLSHTPRSASPSSQCRASSSS